MGRQRPQGLRQVVSRADQLRRHRWADGLHRMNARLLEQGSAPGCAMKQLHALVQLQGGGRYVSVFAGAKKCALKGGQSVRSVFRANPHLVRAGILEKTPGGGRSKANAYYLRRPEDFGSIEEHLVPDPPPAAPLPLAPLSNGKPRPSMVELFKAATARDGP